MNFDLHIENIGKLTDAKIRIGRFTVFAGPNNTGKSFVSKILYSIIDAMNANPVEAYITSLTRFLYLNLNRFEGESELLPLVRAEIEELRSMIVASSVGGIEVLDSIIPECAKRVEKIKKRLPYLRQSLKESTEASFDWENDIHEDFLIKLQLNKDLVDNLEQFLNELEKNFSSADMQKLISSGLGQKVHDNLIENFQVATLSDLQKSVNFPSKININDCEGAEFLDGEFKFRVGRALFDESQNFSHVIYLESPVYSKLKNALEGFRLESRGHSRKRLSGVPGYFYDLMSTLRYKYGGNMAFPKIYERLTGKDVLGGEIKISELGELLFQENDRSFPMSTTATGTTNLGMLALLIERRVLDTNALIFIDEPESNLHPAWQVVMAEVLFELAKGGVNVVIATHSADILKWLEVHVKKNPDDEKLIALNKFPVNGDALDEQDFSDKIADIKQELTKPFADLYVAGL